MTLARLDGGSRRMWALSSKSSATSITSAAKIFSLVRSFTCCASICCPTFLCVVIGTLDAANYALFVSHSHPDGQLNFNVFSSPRAGQQWGDFTVTNDLSSSMVAGPVYDEPEGHTLDVSAKKVSKVGRGGKWDVVLLARLRFTTDGVEPTSK